MVEAASKLRQEARHYTANASLQDSYRQQHTVRFVLRGISCIGAAEEGAQQAMYV